MTFSLILYILIPEYANSLRIFIFIIPTNLNSDFKSISLTFLAFFFWYSRISSKLENSVFTKNGLTHSGHT